MRRCKRCRQPRPTSEYGTARGTCHACRKEQERARATTPEARGRRRAIQSARCQEARVLLDSLKGAPCTDCGGTFPPLCMDFDHREPRGSRLTVAAACASGSIPRMLREIERCNLVCKNCHAIRTDRRHRDGTVVKRGRPRLY